MKANQSKRRENNLAICQNRLDKQYQLTDRKCSEVEDYHNKLNP